MSVNETQKYNELLEILADKVNKNIVRKSDIENLMQKMKGKQND